MLCKRKRVRIVEAEMCPDHVHMLVELPSSISVSSFVGYLKGKSTLIIFERHANVGSAFFGMMKRSICAVVPLSLPCAFSRLVLQLEIKYSS